MLIKAGLMTFGLIIVVVLLLTLIVKIGGKGEEKNPYATSNRNYPRDNYKQEETKEAEEVQTYKTEEQEMPPTNHGEQGNNKRDIGPKPPSFKL